jgi:hypothetical protein
MEYEVNNVIKKDKTLFVLNIVFIRFAGNCCGQNYITYRKGQFKNSIYFTIL